MLLVLVPQHPGQSRAVQVSDDYVAEVAVTVSLKSGASQRGPIEQVPNNTWN